jgi:coenzyme F420-reducing hydrogenase beta subunit
MNEICDKDLCTGCCMCYNCCTANAITMTENLFGCLVPDINANLCTNCNLCAGKCPVNNVAVLNKNKKVYAAWAKEKNEHTSSSSGGMASVLYETFINQYHGICAGVKFTKGLHLTYRLFYNSDERFDYKGSKYVQCYADHVYSEIKAHLKHGEYILFISTPCQIAALKSYLGKEAPGLFTVDLICHGVPPLSYLQEHLKKYLKNDPEMITGFRTGNHFRLTVSACNEIKKLAKDIYLQSFLAGLTYRESCYSCKYACCNRIGDITIGDFWGLSEDIASIPDAKDGVSVVLVNTDKGGSLFDLCKDKLIFYERTLEEACKENAQLNHAAIKPKSRFIFLFFYKIIGFDIACNIAYICIYLQSRFLKRIGNLYNKILVTMSRH